MAAYCLETSLRLLHPFIPFITEELWQQLPHSGPSLMVARYPVGRHEWVNADVEKQMEDLQELISAVRTARSENNIDPRKKASIELLSAGDKRRLIESQVHQLESLARLNEVKFVSHLGENGLRVQGVSRLAEFSLILDEVVDVEAERQRLSRQIDRVKNNVLQLGKKLENQDFLQRAPEQVVDAARQHHSEAAEQLGKLRDKLNAIGGQKD